MTAINTKALFRVSIIILVNEVSSLRGPDAVASGAAAPGLKMAR
jgi:hypothetical protein